MNYRSFVIKIVTIVIICVVSGSSFIYFMDPMWLFGHKHKYNDVQTVIDERQQKTNVINYQSFEYDTLLLGSSRSTYINQNDFEGMDVYNFSVSFMSISEYNSFIEFAKKKRGKEFKRIIIGLDFFKSSINQGGSSNSYLPYIENLDDPFYRAKSLLSYDSLEYSWENFKMSRKNRTVEERNYNRENVATATVLEPKQMKELVESKIEKFRNVFYGDTYQYNPNYAKVLSGLKKNNPNTEFIVFTTPISSALFEVLVEEGRLPDYEKWLNDVTEVFGGVYNFMYPNKVTDNLANYFDGHHFYPHVGTLIAHRISHTKDPNLPADFGQYVDKNRLQAHLNSIRKESKELLAKN